MSQSDNLVSRLSRAHISDNEFTDDSGKVVKYKRLVLTVLVKGESVELPIKVDKKDLLILGMADTVDTQKQF
ncbi:MAG: hypothetical protein WAS27_02485 [Candidatus Saccharimonadales bacterium]